MTWPWSSTKLNTSSADCDGAPDCPYVGERKNVIFACSATPLAAKDTFRLFFGGGDGNVGTAVVRVTPAARGGAGAVSVEQQ